MKSDSYIYKISNSISFYQEEEFQSKFTAQNSLINKYLLLILGIIYLLGFAKVFIGDSYLLMHMSSIYFSLLSRFFIFSYAIIYFILLHDIKNQKIATYFILFFYHALFLSYLVNIKLQKVNLFPLEFFGSFLIICCMILSLRHFMQTVLNSLIMLIIFALFEIYLLNFVNHMLLMKCSIYLALAVLFTLVHSFILEKRQYKQFIEQKIAEDRSSIDKLTGCMNRWRFDDIIAEWIAIANYNLSVFSIIVLDLDNFKIINDTYGHLVGDEVLSSFVSLINNEIREQDIFARWGGDEFILLLPLTESKQAAILAEHLREIVERHQFVNGLKITISFGVAQSSFFDNAYSLVQRADKLLYGAKKLGGNQVAV